MKKGLALVPDYYPEFHCIGSECEESCCGFGWVVTIDRETYRKYKQHKNPVLAPLFRDGIQKNTDPNLDKKYNYGVIQLKPEYGCVFLDENKLCVIQKNLGEQALCNTCMLFPRSISRLGSQLEYSLLLSCPEAARLILLHPEPINFFMVNPSVDMRNRDLPIRSFPKNAGVAASIIAEWVKLRSLSISILQHRQLSINARLMLLGIMAEEMERITKSSSFKDVSKLQPVMALCEEALHNAAAFQAQFLEMEPNQVFKLQTLGGILTSSLATHTGSRFTECLVDMMEALYSTDEGKSSADVLARYEAAYRNYYSPFFHEHEYILENYLVNEVFRTIFPLMEPGPLHMYRELLCNYAIARLILVGMAGAHQGLTEELVVKLFQSFSRKSSHDTEYLRNLLRILQEQNSESLMHMMWLLIEHDE